MRSQRGAGERTKGLAALGRLSSTLGSQNGNASSAIAPVSVENYAPMRARARESAQRTDLIRLLRRQKDRTMHARAAQVATEQYRLEVSGRALYETLSDRLGDTTASLVMVVLADSDLLHPHREG